MRTFHLPREEGQGLVEYGIALVLVGVVLIVILSVFGDGVQGKLCGAASSVGADTEEYEYCDQLAVETFNHTYKEKSNQSTFIIKVRYNGDDNDNIDIVSVPGGMMTKQGKKNYAIKFQVSGCPKTLTFRANTGIMTEYEVPKCN